MDALAVPQVTEHDLSTFHAAHFPHGSAPSSFVVDSTTSELPDVDDGIEDGGLGWYPDGTKRYLTDEQIKIFRHSEIQQLLKQFRSGQTPAGSTSPTPTHEERREHDRFHEGGSLAPSSARGQSEPQGEEAPRKRLKPSSTKRKRKNRMQNSGNIENSAGMVPSVERDELADEGTPQSDGLVEVHESKRSKGNGRERKVDDGMGSFTDRRKAREQDEIPFESTELSYDD